MAIVVADESFKKPGAIPFDWETRPGVSKFEQYHNHELPTPKSFGSTSFNSSPSKELQTQWVQSMSLGSSSKSKYGLSSSLTRLGLVPGQNGCFPISWLRWKWGKEKRVVAKPKLKLKLELDPDCIKDYTFYIEKLASLSMLSSSRRLSSSSFSSRIQRASLPSTSTGSSSSSTDDEVALSRLFRNLFGFLSSQNMIRKGGENNQVNITIVYG
ncbi:hypothetical protein SOVF_198440 [Spinacia oleracea]|nr:hypothetical protein SOVF_198440 [Spinacia oleracea]